MFRTHPALGRAGSSASRARRRQERPRHGIRPLRLAGSHRNITGSRILPSGSQRSHGLRPPSRRRPSQQRARRQFYESVISSSRLEQESPGARAGRAPGARRRTYPAGGRAAPSNQGALGTDARSLPMLDAPQQHHPHSSSPEGASDSATTPRERTYARRPAVCHDRMSGFNGQSRDPLRSETRVPTAPCTISTDARQRHPRGSSTAASL